MTSGPAPAAPGPARADSGPVLAASGIGKRFGRRVVLDGADLSARSGEIVAVVGENGAGKTTLLRVCAGLLRPDTGRVVRSGRVGYCPQEPVLLERLSARDHLVLFGGAAGWDRERSLSTGTRLLEALGFAGRSRVPARRLSGGGRQKLNLVLSLLGDPGVLLLDEPYQGLDHGSYAGFWELAGTWRDDGKAVVVVTHMLAELWRADRVIEVAA
ncbi:ABC transporter ATP-binding protein [Actinomadura montaniterrae]|uniref:ABC transporter ATP-binding protein n=1 Tax=Actinomadura montaniterrae TaxID=1803903 RepID=A0A6L3W4D8_9ACTN|nr:ABC transporter ATP-binding protein [Actinomadura montaniterrae]KAB2388438.1 ABC transporter ATP-binding protein [Actinomadura montaniterrae]